MKKTPGPAKGTRRSFVSAVTSRRLCAREVVAQEDRIGLGGKPHRTSAHDLVAAEARRAGVRHYRAPHRLVGMGTSRVAAAVGVEDVGTSDRVRRVLLRGQAERASTDINGPVPKDRVRSL